MPESSLWEGQFRRFEQIGESDEIRTGEAGKRAAREDPAGVAPGGRDRGAAAERAGQRPARAGAESATRERQAAAGTASAIRPRAAVARARATGTVSAAATP